MDQLIRDMRDAAKVILALPPYSRAIASPAVQLAVMAQKAADELEKRRWVSFEEKQPEDAQDILVWGPSYGHVAVTTYYELWGPGYTHTHWMPLPSTEGLEEGEEMTRAELRYIVARHEKWLRHPDSGERADLRRANLRGANLRGADLRRANLQGADLRWADLQRADLRDANLRDANLRGADLQGANLRGANLRDANLQGADLDFSAWPLWCGSLKAKVDDIFIVQLLYHTLSLAKNSDISAQLRAALDTDDLIAQVNRFHRIDECPELKRWPQEEHDHERADTESVTIRLV